MNWLFPVGAAVAAVIGYEWTRKKLEGDVTHVPLGQSTTALGQQAQAAAMSFHPASGPMATADVQRTLNALGADPPLAVDGVEGSKTTAAVKAFQAKTNLTVDGVVGPQTAAALRLAASQSGVATSGAFVGQDASNPYGDNTGDLGFEDASAMSFGDMAPPDTSVPDYRQLYMQGAFTGPDYGMSLNQSYDPSYGQAPAIMMPGGDGGYGPPMGGDGGWGYGPPMGGDGGWGYGAPQPDYSQAFSDIAQQQSDYAQAQQQMMQQMQDQQAQMMQQMQQQMQDQMSQLSQQQMDARRAAAAADRANRQRAAQQQRQQRGQPGSTYRGQPRGGQPGGQPGGGGQQQPGQCPQGQKWSTWYQKCVPSGGGGFNLFAHGNP